MASRLDADIAAHQKSLDEALLAFMAGNEEPLAAHITHYVVLVPADPDVVRGGILKCITARKSLPIENRRQAKAELEAIGMQSLDDGDL